MSFVDSSQQNDITHLRLKSVPSTQEFLRDYLQKQDLKSRDSKILVTSEIQTEGRGRGSNRWESLGQSLAFSFTMPPHPILSLSSLEVAVLLVQFLNENFNLVAMLKWPNDLLSKDGKKVGGILIHSDETLIVGVGLNWCAENSKMKDCEFQYAHLADKKLSPKDFHDLPASFYQYVSSHRLESKEVRTFFKKHCFHWGKQVTMMESGQNLTGLFHDIGEGGEALLQTVDGKIHPVYSGSLRFLI